jgi:conjugative relaxase-like TrwC/TraI family protein
VVAVMRIARGHSVEYVLKAVAAGRENYYTGAVAEGEPPGRWHGTGAAALGLTGEVVAQDMRAVFEHFVDPSDPAFHDPAGWDTASKLGHPGRNYVSAEEIYQRSLEAEPHADAERREELRIEASKAERKNVAFFDATFSAQKSVTVLHTAFESQEVAARNAGRLEEAEAWVRHRQAIEDGMHAGNRAMLDYLAAHAGYSRIGHHGGAGGRYIDAHGLVVTSFFQHDSRDHDPQLHIHNPILNRVRCADGKWRTLDGRSLYRFRPAAAAVGERVMEEHIAHALGVEFATRPDGAAREIVGIPQAVMDLFSSRTRAITPKTRALIEGFEAEFGRAPNGLERDRLAQQATLATRRAKSHTGQTREQMLRAWDQQLRAEIRGGLATLAHDVLAKRAAALAPMTWSPVAVLETALAAVQEKKAGWTSPDLTREISNALPARLGITNGAQLASLLDRLTAEGLKLAVALDAARPGAGQEPAAYRLANGQSAFQAPGAALFATPGHVHTERILVGAAAAKGAAAMDTAATEKFFAQLSGLGVELGADQAAAVRGLLTSGARLESLIGPAGTGKSFVLGAVTKAWCDPGLWEGRAQRAFGLATSQKAAEVLSDDGITASNTAAWLAAQNRITEHRPLAGDERWALRAGDLVVVDESSMADTTDLDTIRRHVHAAGAKMVLTGDFHQLGAIGAGGALEMVAGAGTSYELTEARRFTQPWERTASLRLRTGDTSVIEEYHRHGRIIDGGTAEQAEHLTARCWLGDTLAGKHALLIVDTNEQAGRINADLRAELVRLGRVTETGVRLGRDGNIAGVGDLVRAKTIAWELAGYRGNTEAPVTQKQYRVLQTHDDGSMIVAPINTTHGSGEGETLGAPMTLPAAYVARHMTLGYAVTEHGAQGVTVDTGYEIATATTSANALYPGATRGRESNTVVVVTQTAPAADSDTGEIATAIRRDPRAVISSILETAERDQAATAMAAESAAQMGSIATAGEMFAEIAGNAATERTAGWLDELTATGALTAEQRQRLAAEDGATSLGRMLRRVELAGHNPHHVLTDAIGERGLDGARGLTNVIHKRIVEGWTLAPAGEAYQQWLPDGIPADTRQYLETVAAAGDTRREQLGADTVAEPPRWAIDSLGPVPDELGARLAWQHKAGVIAAHRELSGHDDPDIALGAAPPPGQVEAHASWTAAWRALDRPAGDDEGAMSDGQLRMRVRAYEREQAWAPRQVANELAGTIQARDHQRSMATRLAAEADITTDAQVRARLGREAGQAGALADTLGTQVAELEQLGHERGLWLAHTAGTRAAYDRARQELLNRRALDERPETQVTAAEWVAAHDHAMREDDAHRPITDDGDLADHTTDHNVEETTYLGRSGGAPDCDADADEASLTGINDRADARPAAETKAGGDARAEQQADEAPQRVGTTGLPEDLREIAAAEPAPADEHAVRVPTAQDTAESRRRAQRALEEIAARDAADQTRLEQERQEELARWHAQDTAHHDTRGADRVEAADRDSDTRGSMAELGADDG